MVPNHLYMLLLVGWHSPATETTKRINDRDEQWAARLRERDEKNARAVAEVRAQAEARIVTIREDAAAAAEVVNELHARQLETLHAEHRWEQRLCPLGHVTHGLPVVFVGESECGNVNCSLPLTCVAKHRTSRRAVRAVHSNKHVCGSWIPCALR